jgi:hypothetical protein
LHTVYGLTGPARLLAVSLCVRLRYPLAVRVARLWRHAMSP